MAEKLYYTWEQFENDIKSIRLLLKDRKQKISYVYGIPKGGLPLAVKLCNVLKVPLAPNLFHVAPLVKSKKEILIVDDIVDSGNTFLKIPYIRCYTTLSLFIREGARIYPKMWITKIKDKRWVCFPWEDTEEVNEARDGTTIFHPDASPR